MNVRGPLIFAGCAALAYFGWLQLAEDEALRELAAEVACEDVACEASFEKTKRELFGRTFYFRTFGAPPKRVEVGCTRVFWIAGEYSCQVLNSNTTYDRRLPDDAIGPNTGDYR